MRSAARRCGSSASRITIARRSTSRSRRCRRPTARRRSRFRSLEAADRRLAQFYETLQRIDAFVAQGGDGGEGAVLPEAEKLVPDARAALADDFNAPVVDRRAPRGGAAREQLLDEGKGIDKRSAGARSRGSAATCARSASALGVFAHAAGSVPRASAATRLVQARRASTSRRSSAKIAERTAARAAKDFARADAIRGELAALGVELHDTPGGTDWRYKTDGDRRRRLRNRPR